MKKKSGLAGALQVRKAINEPEPIPEPPAQPIATDKAEKKPRRFHTTLYPDPELYRKIRIALLEQNEGRDFNQLVNELLRDWYDQLNEQ